MGIDPVLASERDEAGCFDGIGPGSKVKILAGPNQGEMGRVGVVASGYYPLLLWEVWLDGSLTPMHLYPHEVKRPSVLDVFRRL